MDLWKCQYVFLSPLDVYKIRKVSLVSIYHHLILRFHFSQGAGATNESNKIQML